MSEIIFCSSVIAIILSSCHEIMPTWLYFFMLVLLFMFYVGGLIVEDKMKSKIEKLENKLDELTEGKK